MANKLTITNPTGDHEENLERWAKNLGRSEQRIAVFKEIYRGQKRSKTAAEISETTGLPELRVLQLGAELVDRHLANAEQKGNPPRKAFAKDANVKPWRDKILRLAESPEKIDEIPTKRKGQSILGATETPPRLLVLNACDTDHQAQLFLDVVDHVVAMSSSISDLAAATYAAAFYAALASGQPLDKAFAQGGNALKIIGSPDAHLPSLRSKTGIIPSKFKLV
jgi:hypothetical protein